MLQRIKNKIAIFLVLFLLLIYTSSAVIIDKFNSVDDAISLSFPSGDPQTYSIDNIPNGNVINAEMRIVGLYVETLLNADVIIVTDVSGSMDDDCPGGSADPGETPCKINDAKTAAISFLNNVDLSSIEVGLVDYSTCPTAAFNVLSLTDNYDSLVGEINTYVAGGWTNMGGGMKLAIDELINNGREDADKYILVLTDGEANRAFDASDNCISPGVAASKDYVRAMANLAEDNNIEIFGIAFGSDADRDLVQEITTIGGPYYAPDAAKLKEIYDGIAQSLVQQFFPTPTISSTSPIAIDGWWTNTEYDEDQMWNNDACLGDGVSCIDYRNFIRQNLDACGDPCDISFSVTSSTPGQLDLSELFIEIETIVTTTTTTSTTTTSTTTTTTTTTTTSTTTTTTTTTTSTTTTTTTTTTTIPPCGDGDLDPGEECDLGINGDDSDGCTDDCKFFDFGSKCNDCPCLLPLTYTCLDTNNCLDGNFNVYNPYIWIKPKPDLSDSLRPYYIVNFFVSLDPNFDITFPSLPYSVIKSWKIDGSGVADGVKSAAIVEIRTDAGNDVRFCPELTRSFETVGVTPDVIETELLISKSKSVIGYYEQSGGVVSTGPYIFTAKVWLRE